LADKVSGDAKVRKWCNVPNNRYYTLSIWPEKLAGNVCVDNTRTRVVTTPKISKSDVK
jgi:hypothetical protein